MKQIHSYPPKYEKQAFVPSIEHGFVSQFDFFTSQKLPLNPGEHSHSSESRLQKPLFKHPFAKQVVAEMSQFVPENSGGQRHRYDGVGWTIKLTHLPFAQGADAQKSDSISQKSPSKPSRQTH